MFRCRASQIRQVLVSQVHGEFRSLVNAVILAVMLCRHLDSIPQLDTHIDKNDIMHQF